MSRINASATVEQELQHIQSAGLRRFRVTVTGQLPHDYVRMYMIQAQTEDQAAFEGIEKFVSEISDLIKDKAHG